MTKDAGTAPQEAEVQPVIVFGALRSGTTVFRLMIEAHPQLANPGEVDFLFDHLHPTPDRPDGWRYDLEALRRDRIFANFGLDLPPGCDGLDLLAHMIRGLVRSRAGGARIVTLNVHRNADRIAAVLPEARFIHLIRDPRDVGRSSIGMGWAGNSYFGVRHWIGTETGWDKARLPTDRVLTVRFEELIGDIEAELARVCAFLAVDYDPVMLNYHHGTNFGPPDPKIASSWRRKSTAREVALMEGQIGKLLTDRGYTPNGAPRYPGSAERMLLSLDNDMKRWQFNIRRYGLGLFLATHATRLPGLGILHRRLRQRQENIRSRMRK